MRPRVPQRGLGSNNGMGTHSRLNGDRDGAPVPGVNRHLRKYFFKKVFKIPLQKCQKKMLHFFLFSNILCIFFYLNFFFIF